MLPEYLYHYYDCSQKPFRNLSDLSPEAAEQVLETIRQKGAGFASRRDKNYLTNRREIEAKIREAFIKKGGNPTRNVPHYLILGRCDWVKEWYVNGCKVCMPLASVDPTCMSFTYGDSFPAMRYEDGKPYRKQVYVLSELPQVIEQFGLPQVWNAHGEHGPERYIEAQVWDDSPLVLAGQ